MTDRAHPRSQNYSMFSPHALSDTRYAFHDSEGDTRKLTAVGTGREVVQVADPLLG